MIKINGKNFIGLFEGLPYGKCTEHIEDYSRKDCKISRSSVLNRLNTIHRAYTSAPTKDLFTGESFLAGICSDGDFNFTTDFIRYYEQGKVEIPKEYEDYLINLVKVS